MKCWKEILRQSLSSREQLEDFFQHSFPATSYSISLPLSMAHKIKAQGLDGPLALQFLPNRRENLGDGHLDPIGDRFKRREGGIIHRYNNRILFSPTPHCPVQCRYCFRKNVLEDESQHYRNSAHALDQYLSGHPEVDEVILTGGDPLMVADQVLERYLSTITGHPQVKFVRLHSRTPVMVPERMTHELIELCQTFQQKLTQIHLVVHTNHWSEMDDAVLSRLGAWRGAGLSLMAQSVLLKGVNDEISVLYKLFYRLAAQGIRPYYLHHPDRARGAMHFYLSPERGWELYRPLRKRLSGWALPHYIVDHEDGEGKTFAYENLTNL